MSDTNERKATVPEAVDVETAKFYLEKLHPDPCGYKICPRGWQSKEEHTGATCDEFITDSESEAKWSGSLGSGGVDGSKEFIVNNLNKEIKIGDSGIVAKIEQVTANGFREIIPGSNGLSEDTVGLKNIFIDFDNVQSEDLVEFQRWLARLGMPTSFSIFSGKKGVHLAICLSSAVSSESYAEKVCNAVYEVMIESGVERWGIDGGTLKGKRKYTSAIRLPGLMRCATGKVQSLIQEWAGEVALEKLEHFLDINLKDWRKKSKWKISKVKSPSYKNTETTTPRAKAYKAMSDFALMTGFIYSDFHFWKKCNDTHYEKVELKKNIPNPFWNIYREALGYDASDKQFHDILASLSNDLKTNPANHQSLLNFQNGVLDFNKMTVQPNSITYAFNYVLPINFNADWLTSPPPTPVWDAIKNEHINSEDQELLEAYFGYAATDDRSKQQMLLLNGGPDTGKGTLIKFLQDLLGPELTTTGSIDSIINDQAFACNIIGKRVCFATEARLQLKDLDKFKSLISMESVQIHIFYKGKESIPHGCKFLCSSNNSGWLPNLPEIEKRIRVVKFFNTVPIDKKDILLDEKLYSEREAIFHKCLAAYLRIKDKKDIPLNQSTREYLSEASENINPVATWKTDYDVREGIHWVPLDFLYEKYCTDSRDTKMQKHDFGRKLIEAGIKKGSEENSKSYQGRNGISARGRGRYVNDTVFQDYSNWSKAQAYTHS